MASISFQCYSCNQVLKVGAEKAGKRGKCPKCGTALTIPLESSVTAEAPKPAAPKPAPPKPAPPRPAVRPGAPPPVPLRAEFVEDELEEMPPLRAQAVEEDEGDERPVKKRKASWGMAGIGLLIVFIAFCIMALGEVLGVVGLLLLTIMQISRSGSLGMVNTVHTLGGMHDWVFFADIGIREWILFGSVAGALAGYVLCILVPNKSGTMPLAITTTALAAVYVLLYLIAVLAIKPRGPMGPFDRGGGGSPRGFQVMLLIGQLLFCAQLILFCLYLNAVLVAKKAARYANPMPTMVLACAYAGVGLLLGIFCFVTPTTALGWIVIIVSWIAHGLFITFLVRYILLLWNVRSLIS